MTTVVSIMMSDIVALQDRGMWQGYINIIYAAGAGCGAPLGGLLADSIGWRWAFMGQAPLCLLAFLAVSMVLQLPAPEEKKQLKAQLGRIDFLGALVLVSAVFGMLLGFDRGSNVAWTIPLSYGPLLASAGLFALFLLVETRYAREPFAPGHIIFDRGLCAGYLCNFFSFGGWLAAIYYIPLFFQAVDGYGAAASGVRLLPAILAGVSGSLLAGYIMKRSGKYYWLTVAAYAMLVMGMVLIFLFAGTIRNSIWGLVLGMVLCGLGNGIGVTTTLIALISNASPEDQAVTTACSYLFRSLGSVIGIALSSTVVQQSLRNYLRRELGSGEEAERIVQRVRRSLDSIWRLDPEVRDVVRRCYGHAVRDALALMIGITFFASLSSFLIREKRLSR
jgi:predicted MFS family arabinose efflux permease